MEYKGYVARVEFDESANVFHGQVLNIRDVITFEGRSVDELWDEFKNSVEDYLEFCAERGEEPEKPYSGKFLVRVDPEVHRAAAIAAGKAGVSLNSWVLEAIKKALAPAQETLPRDLPHRPGYEVWTGLQKTSTVALRSPQYRQAHLVSYPADKTRYGWVEPHWTNLITSTAGSQDEWAES